MQENTEVGVVTGNRTDTENTDIIVYENGYGDIDDENFSGKCFGDNYDDIYFDKPGYPFRKVVIVKKSLLVRRVILDHRYNENVVIMCETCLESELPCNPCYERLLENVVGMMWAECAECGEFPNQYTREEVIRHERRWLKEYRKETWAMDEFDRTTLKKLMEEFAADRFHSLPPTSSFVRGSSLTESGNLKLVECNAVTAIFKKYDTVSDHQRRYYKSIHDEFLTSEYENSKEKHIVNIKYNFHIPCDDRFVIQIFGSPPESLTDATVQYIFFLHNQLDGARKLVTCSFSGYKLTGFVDCLNDVGFLEFVKEDFVEEWNDMYTIIKGSEDTGSITDGITEDRMFRLNQLTSFERLTLFTDKGKHQIYDPFYYSDNVGIYVNGAWKVVADNYYCNKH